MYLIRCKVSHGAECVRKRSIALNPGYIRLVGHHCCARQLLTSGVAKPKAADAEGHATLEKPMNMPGSKKGRKLVVNTLGYVNSLHYDLCDLIIKSLVPLYIARFVREVKSSKRYLPSEKKKLINKVQEINSLVGIGLPTTCAHNIICSSKLPEVASLSSLFIMFDFAMTLGHKTVHNFFGWSFVHCTALPILIFHDGTVSISNDDNEEEHSVVVIAWGNNGGSKESQQNTKMKSRKQNKKKSRLGNTTTNRIVERISIM